MTALFTAALLAAGCAGNCDKPHHTLTEFGQSAADGAKHLGSEIAEGAVTAYDKAADSEIGQSAVDGAKRLGSGIAEGVETVIDKVKN